MERLSITEAMPLAQSTAMDEEYGVTTKPEVIPSHNGAATDTQLHDPSCLFSFTDITTPYDRRLTPTGYRDQPTMASWTCRIPT